MRELLTETLLTDGLLPLAAVVTAMLATIWAMWRPATLRGGRASRSASRGGSRSPPCSRP